MDVNLGPFASRLRNSGWCGGKVFMRQSAHSGSEIFSEKILKFSLAWTADTWQCLQISYLSSRITHSRSPFSHSEPRIVSRYL